MPKLTKLYLHLLSYAEKTLASFFPDTVYNEKLTQGSMTHAQEICTSRLIQGFFYKILEYGSPLAAVNDVVSVSNSSVTPIRYYPSTAPLCP